MKIIISIAVLVGILATTIQAMPQYEYSAPSDVQEEEAAIERADYDKNVEELASVMAFGILDGMMEDNILQDIHISS